MPRRVQITRSQPWRRERPDAVIVGRPTRLGYRAEDVRRELANKDLVCWCPLSEPCHADVLLEITNP